MNRIVCFILSGFLMLSLCGCETGKGVLSDTQSVLNSVAGIINSGKTISDIAK